MLVGKGGVSALILAPRRDRRSFSGNLPPVTLEAPPHRDTRNNQRPFSFRFSFRILDMKYTWLILTSCLLLVLAELVTPAQAGPYLDEGKSLMRFLFPMLKKI